MLTKRGQSSLLTVGEHEWGAAAGSGGGTGWFAGEGLKHLQYLLFKRFMSPLQGFLRSCPVYPGRCPGLSHWRTIGACKMGSVLTIDSWRAWRGEQKKVRAGAPLVLGKGAVLELLMVGSQREHALPEPDP